jgi:hypothetical protein
MGLPLLPPRWSTLRLLPSPFKFGLLCLWLHIPYSKSSCSSMREESILWTTSFHWFIYVVVVGNTVLSWDFLARFGVCFSAVMVFAERGGFCTVTIEVVLDRLVNLWQQYCIMCGTKNNANRVRFCSGLISPTVAASSDLVSHNLRIGVKEWGATALDEFLSSNLLLASSVWLKIIQFACSLYLQVYCDNIGSWN